MDSAVGNDKDTKECMNDQSYASNEQSQQGEKEIASAIETNFDIEAFIENTKKCLTNESAALATTNIYVSTDVARQISMFNVYNNTSTSGRIFDYNYKIGNLTMETKDAPLDENYYKVNIYASKIKDEHETSNEYSKEEDVESESVYSVEDDYSYCANNIYSGEDNDSERAYKIYVKGHVDSDDNSDSAYIYKEEDDDSESAYNVYNKEGVVSESAYNVYNKEGVVSESAYNVYNKEGVVSESVNNIYNKKGFVSESANNIYNKEGVVSESAYNVYNKKGFVSESANNIYNKEGVVSESVNNIYNKEGVVSESVNNIYNKEGVVSESVNNIYNKKGFVSESANNIYDKEDIVCDGANSTICENVDFHTGTEDDEESGQIVGSMFLTDYSLNAVIVIDETNHNRKSYYCCVCDYLVEDEENINLHMKSSNHLKALKLSPPLENNERIRYIYDQYHCAVCDKLFKGPLLNHFVGASHILCETFAKNKALNLRQRKTLNEKTNKEKTKSDRQNDNVPKSILDLDSDANCSKLVECVKKEVSSQANENLSSPLLAKSAYENNCHIQKSRFPDYNNIIPESSYGENSNLFRSATSSEVYQENCNLPSPATLEFYNFLKYMEAYKRKKCNLSNLANSEIFNFPKCKEAREENFNFPDQATIELFYFFKHMQAYKETFDSNNSTSPENYSFPKSNQSYERNCNLSNTTTSENSNLDKRTHDYKENSNYVPQKSSYKEKCNVDFNKPVEITNRQENEYKKSSYKEKCNVDFNKPVEITNRQENEYKKSSYKEKCNVDFNEPVEIINRQENEYKVNKNVKRNKSKNEMTSDELENLVENLYEARVFNRNTEFIVEFLGTALSVDLKSYNFIKKVTKSEMFCMICYIYVEKKYFDSHINKVTHIIKVKNAYYDPVYGCHLLRPMPCKRYHCTLCNEEFVRKMLTTHIMSDNHKNQLAKSLITNWVCDEPYNEENCPMMTEKEPQVLPVLESQKILEDNKLKMIDSMPEKTEMVSSNDVGLDAKEDSVLPVSEVEEILEVTELNIVDWIQEKTETVSSNGLKYVAFTDEVLSEDLNREIPPVLPVLESEKIFEDNKLKMIDSMPEKTEMVFSTDEGFDSKKDSLLPMSEVEEILEVTELNIVDWIQEKTETVSPNGLKYVAFTDEVLSEDLNRQIPPVLPVLESEKIFEDNKLKMIDSKPEKTELVSSSDVGLDAKTDEVLSEDLNREIPPVLPVLEYEKILEDNKLKMIDSKPEKTELVSSSDVGLDAKTDDVLSEGSNENILSVLHVLESAENLNDTGLKSAKWLRENIETSNEFSI